MYKAALISIAISAPAGCGMVVDPNDPGEPPEALAVELTSPAVDQPVRDVVVVAANAIAAGGVITSVRFDLPDGDTVTDGSAPFSTMWDSTTVADGAHVMRATAIDDQGTARTAHATIFVDNGGACLGETGDALGLPRNIPDNNPSGITSSIQIAGSGTVASLSLSLDIRHPAPIDLELELISPAGTRFGVTYPEMPNPNIRITGRAITAFNGQAAAGAWKLRVADHLETDVGALHAWSLQIAKVCAPTPGPDPT
jgi:hypothetical protein